MLGGVRQIVASVADLIDAPDSKVCSVYVSANWRKVEVYRCKNAGVAELVDARASKTRSVRSVGSIPTARTTSPSIWPPTKIFKSASTKSKNFGFQLHAVEAYLY